MSWTSLRTTAGYIKIKKGIPGLKKAGKISNNRLEKIWQDFGYEPMRHTPALWTHASHDIVFTLVVDDFGVKYKHRKYEENLRNDLQKLYPGTTDWTGSKVFGLTLNWYYINRTVDLYMPNYVPVALHKFQHEAPYKT